MRRRQLFIYVEGDDDHRLFDRKIKQLLANKYSQIAIRKYVRTKSEIISREVQTIKKSGAIYLFTVDFDSGPCVSGKKEEIMKRYLGVEKERILVIKKEIESWYLAGIDDSGCSKLGLSASCVSTDDVGKKRFDALIPKRFDSRIHFMSEIVDCHFCVETARKRNSSFDYFLRKHDC